MNERFENLHVNALHLADADLQSIADTEQLTEAQNLRIAECAMQKAGILPESKRPKLHKKRIRMLGVLIAAVIAVLVLGVGASGWLTYNKPLIQSYFGTIGDERLQSLELPEPQTVSNGKVTATVEACLRDRNKMLVLITFDSAEGYGEIEWQKMMRPGDVDDCFIYSGTILDENGEPVGTQENPYRDIYSHSMGLAGAPKDGAATVEMEMQIVNPEFNPDTLMLRFSNSELGTLDVPVTVTPCLETLTLEAENSKTNSGVNTMYLSPIGIRIAPTVFMLDQEHDAEVILTRRDGSQIRAHLNSMSGEGYSGEDGKWSYCEGMLYEITEGMEFDDRNPETYNGFVDISDVVSVDCFGLHFTLTE